MGREATVTYEQVVAAAEALQAEGIHPTARTVRERIGHGSMTTINRFLQAWKAATATSGPAPPKTPPSPAPAPAPSPPPPVTPPLIPPPPAPDRPADPDELAQLRARVAALEAQLAKDEATIVDLECRLTAALAQAATAPLPPPPVFLPIPGADAPAAGSPWLALKRFPAPKQQRMDELLDLNNQGRLAPEERAELEALVFEAQALALSNAQALGQPAVPPGGSDRTRPPKPSCGAR